MRTISVLTAFWRCVSVMVKKADGRSGKTEVSRDSGCLAITTNISFQIPRTSSSCLHTTFQLAGSSSSCSASPADAVPAEGPGRAQLQQAPCGGHHSSRFPSSGSLLDSGALNSQTLRGCFSGAVLAGLGAADDSAFPSGVHAPLMPFPASRAIPSVSPWLCQDPPSELAVTTRVCKRPSCRPAAPLLPSPWWPGKAPPAVARGLMRGWK